MLAIPVFRSRVAPVLDWCSKIMIVPEKGTPEALPARHLEVADQSAFVWMNKLREEGVKILICGALSPGILNYGADLGLRIVHGVAGEIEEVLQAYRDGGLDQSRFRLPGCRGMRAHKRGGGCGAKGGKPGTGGTGAFCICVKCGTRMRHERGIPCSRLTCPECESPMLRE